VTTQRDCSFTLDINQCCLLSHKWNEIVDERIQSLLNPVEYELVIGNLQSLSVSHRFRQINIRQMFTMPNTLGQILYIYHTYNQNRRKQYIFPHVIIISSNYGVGWGRGSPWHGYSYI
jgi:hypothetical protein